MTTTNPIHCVKLYSNKDSHFTESIHRPDIPGGAKKRPEHLHALFSQMVEMNQLKSIYVMSKHQ